MDKKRNGVFPTELSVVGESWAGPGADQVLDSSECGREAVLGQAWLTQRRSAHRAVNSQAEKTRIQSSSPLDSEGV